MTAPSGEQAGEAGAIHDIGYRHYDGPRLGAAYVFRSMVTHSLRGAFGLGRRAKSKVAPLALLVLVTLPALIIAAISALGNATKLPLDYSSYALTVQVLVAIFVASQAPQMVSRDLRYRLTSLYFSRPMTHRAYVDAKLLAMSGAVLVLLATPLLVLYAGALLAKMPIGSNTIGFLRGLAGAAVMAVVLAAIGLAISAYTPRRGLGVAAVVTVLLVLSGVGSVVQGIATAQGSEEVAGWAGLISPFSLVDGVQVWLLGAKTSTAQAPPGNLGGVVFVAVAIALVAGCYGLLLLRYRRVSVS